MWHSRSLLKCGSCWQRHKECCVRCSARLSYVDPPLIHITVKFLGEVDEKKLPQVIAALRTVQAAPFPVKGSRITVNNFRSPHTVWCAVDDAGKGRDVFLAVESVLAPLGFSRETRAFTPHATLARVKMADQSLFRCLEKLKDAPCGSCTVSGLKLKKSTLTPRGRWTRTLRRLHGKRES